MIKKVITFVILLCTISESTTDQSNQEYVSQLLAKVLGYRLPNDTVPIKYVLQLDPHIDAEEFTFDGEGKIVIEVLQPIRDITLHASHLEVDKDYTRLVASDGTSWTPISQRWNYILEFFNIRFHHELAVGRYTLKLKWKGRGLPYKRGFYRATDWDSNDNEVFMAATHFQPIAARTAFPCWDEPGLKAEFEIALKHYPNYTALSNMPERNRIETDDGKILTSFETSPMMSTYLVTFLIADYDNWTNDYGNMTYYTTKGDLEKIRLSFEVSSEVLRAMENYTGIAYSLPKLDQITVPQYSSSATEHWGAISYLSFFVQYDINENSLDMRDNSIFLTIHEVSHQWFGNLVTPAWWGDLWLSEAFAVYFSYKISDQIFKNWHGTEIFIIEVINRVAYPAELMKQVRRPIKWYPSTPAEIKQMFGTVTYRKGAAILHMLENIVSEEVFRDGIRKYLDKHRFGVVTTDDFWRALQETYEEKKIHPHLNIKEIMDPWIEQTGYPLLNVTRNYKTGETNVTQSNALDSESDNLWMIPVTITTSTHPDFEYTKPTHWIPRSRDNYTFYGIDKDDWMILNIQQAGFYRVNYDYENWKRIADYLNSDDYHKIHVINRAQLVADIFYFSLHDKTYVELLFDIILYLHQETNYLPWMTVLEIIDYMNQALINTSAYDLFSKLMLHLINNIVDRIGFEPRRGEDHLDALGRKHLLPWACAFDHNGCKKAAQSKLVAYIENPDDNPINSNEQNWVFCAGLEASNESIWENVMNSHLANPRVQPGFEYLGCTKNQYLIKKYLNLALAENATLLKNQISDAFTSILLGPRENIDFALNFFISHIDRIREYFNARNLTNQINLIVDHLSSNMKYPYQYNKFFDFLTSEEKNGKMTRIDKPLSYARMAMGTSERASLEFQSLLAKKPALFNSLRGGQYINAS